MSPGASLLCLPGGEKFVESHHTCVLPFSRKGLAEFAASYYDNPSKKLKVIGITGTNGKSSVVYYLQQLLNFLGEKVLSIGTLTHALTTPESWDIHCAMAQHLHEGGTYVLMEVSSIGLDQGRVLGIDFDVKCLTNISQDHLDYHRDFQTYKHIKLDFLKYYPGKTIGPNDFESLNLNYECPCRFQTLNLQAAVSILGSCGFDLSVISPYFNTLQHPPGRFQFVESNKAFDVVVDYAHSPEGLETVIQEAKQRVSVKSGKLHVVFGCGGDRDAHKRPLMGEIASAWADSIIVTSDNPRNENPHTIIDQILTGIKNPKALYVESDRREAIRYACHNAAANDLVLIAGKGHETVQVVAGETLPFDDVKVAQELLGGME